MSDDSDEENTSTKRKTNLPQGFSSDEEDDDDDDVNDNIAPPSKKSSKSTKKRKKSKSSSSSSKKKKLNSNNNSSSNNNNNDNPNSNQASNLASSMIDDAAVHSGSDGEDSEEDDDDDAEGTNNDYIHDGFVVNDDDDEDDGLSDSDEDDASDDEDGSEGGTPTTNKRTRVRKKRAAVGLSQDDMDLIAESKGTYKPRMEDEYYDEDDDYDMGRGGGGGGGRGKKGSGKDGRDAAARKAKKAAKLNDLRDELFQGKDSKNGGGKNQKKKNNRGGKQSGPGQGRRPGSIPNAVAVDNFDEEGMDDFIEDDVGVDHHGGEYGGDGSGSGRGQGVSEAQINEANDIFGMDFFNVMGDGDADDDGMGGGMGGGGMGGGDDMYDEYGERRRRKYRESGVGPSLGVDSDDDILDDESDDYEDDYDDDDDDMFGEDEDLTSEERAAALRTKREKKRRAKEERRKKKSEQRKARLRRAFEPVQLIENFCTDRDDKIRSVDAPERFFDWGTPFHGPGQLKVEMERGGGEEDVQLDGTVARAITAGEEREALWIVQRVPEIASEYAIVELEASNAINNSNRMAIDNDNDNANNDAEQKKKSIIHSVAKTLRFLHIDKLEPEFIRKYRGDEVTSPAVRDNIYRIMDEDTEWERLLNARHKVETMLDNLTAAAEGDEALGADEEYVTKLKEDLKNAQDRLDESVRDEVRKKAEIDALEKGGGNGEEEDDDLFGDDDDDDDDNKKKDKAEIALQKESLLSHLKTTQSLVKVCAEQVSSIEASLKVAQENSATAQPGQENALITTSQMCRDKLWHHMDYKQYLTTLTDYTHIMDLYNYLTLLKEGNDAVRSKTMPSGNDVNDKDKNKKRSKRFDRDYYRTCVSQGLRRICYQFALSPFRAGIKLEDNITLSGGFSWDKTLPGENPNSGDGDGDDDVGDPKRWNAPVVDFADPTSFASDLVSSGELVLLASMNDGDEGTMNQDHPEVNDPLRGCRYVAAMELAYEPRIRKHLREMYKKRALLTSRPTNKGIDSIDPFHEFYGLHLLRNKKVKDHFYPDQEEMEMETIGFTVDERKEKDERVRSVQKQSCLQYMGVMKAEKSGHLKVYIHLPLVDDAGADWYKKDDDNFTNRDRQDYAPFVEELKKIYYPTNGDMDEWNNQREQIIRLALKKFLLPYFEAEMRRELREASHKAGIKDAGEKLRAMAMEGPYRPSHLLGDNRFLVPTLDLPIVGVCCSSDGRDASYLVAVTERGEVSDHLAIPAGVQIDNGKIREKAITFLMQSRPAAIVVGSHAGLSSRLVARKLGALTTEATERWNNRFIQGQDEDDEEYHTRLDEFRRLYPNHEDDEEDEIEWKCNVEMVDDNIAQLFGRSVRGKKEFPDAAVNQKCAISIARYAKDPLAEIAYTWSVASDAGVFGTEMLFLNVHSLQQLLPKTLLLREYERVICRAVADVGVDINLSCKYDHIHGLLTFVPGLGPRKAASLKQGIDRIGGVVVTRRDLLGKRLVGPFVYNNAVAFLRIRDIDSLRNQSLHPLDDTRLHPHVYHRNNWATKIAIDALEMDNDEATNSGNDDKAISAIRDIMEDSHNEVKRLFDATKAEWERTYGQTFSVDAWDPQVNVPAESWRDKVEELDLETFADMIEKDGKGKWLSHLTMIKWEFRLPFEDPRRPMEPLEKEKLFRMLTGESDQTLCPGREVTGKVARISDFGAHLKLEGDVPAFIPLRNLSDGHVESAEDIVQVGQVVTAIVTEVKKSHMSVDLSLKDEDLKKPPSSWDRPSSLPPLDLSFDSTAAQQIESDKSRAREERLAKMNALLGAGKSNSKSNTAIGRTGKVTNRACGHPAFRNKNFLEIENELKETGLVGEALIRPSKSNADSLSLHWLVREGVTKNIEIIEEDKDNDASIGNTLKIKNETFGSLDELLARYIAPMNDHVEALIEHEKFRNKSEKEVDNELIQQRQNNPRRAAYLLCWNEKYAGYASLRFIVNQTPRSHHIGITPDGFYWYNKNYPDMNYLLNAFKKNPSGTSKSSNDEHSSRGSRSSSSRQSRWNSRAPSSSVPRQAPTWAPPPSHSSTSSGYNRAPQPSLPPPPQHAYPPPPPPGNSGWQQQRPPPPSLPPPPQNRYPPAPPQ